MNKIDEKALGRKPDIIIGELDDPYLLRWFVIPRNRFFNIYLHKFCKSDDDRALHDHPWIFNVSILLKGEYIEHKFVNYEDECMETYTKNRRQFIPYFRWGDSPHRVELLEDSFTTLEKPVWTLFMTGFRVRRWGFYCPKGWKYWRDFVTLREGGNSKGAGCDDE